MQTWIAAVAVTELFVISFLIVLDDNPGITGKTLGTVFVLYLSRWRYNRGTPYGLGRGRQSPYWDYYLRTSMKVSANISVRLRPWPSFPPLKPWFSPSSRQAYPVLVQHAVRLSEANGAVRSPSFTLYSRKYARSILYSRSRFKYISREK